VSIAPTEEFAEFVSVCIPLWVSAFLCIPRPTSSWVSGFLPLLLSLLDSRRLDGLTFLGALFARGLIPPKSAFAHFTPPN
jgi:hypothetical protein